LIYFWVDDLCVGFLTLFVQQKGHIQQDASGNFSPFPVWIDQQLIYFLVDYLLVDLFALLVIAKEHLQLENAICRSLPPSVIITVEHYCIFS
jgi:hypothetical protein